MNQYAELLKRQIWSSIIVIILIFVLAILLLTLNKKHIFDDLGKPGKAVVNVFVVAVIFLVAANFSIRIFHLYKDIHEQAYIVYYGDFEVSPYKERYVTLTSESGKLKLDGKVDLPGGEYSGTVIYAQHSKYVLDWNVNEND